MFEINKNKLMILTMLQEGKITPEEAMQLLDTLEYNSQEIKNKDLTESAQNTIEEFNKKIDVISKCLLQKFEVLSKDLETKLQLDSDKFSKNIVDMGDNFKDKIDRITEEISKNTDGISSILLEKTTELSKTGTGSERMNKSIDELQKYFSKIPIEMPDFGKNISNLFEGFNVENNTLNLYTSVYKKNISDTGSMNLSFANSSGSISMESYDENDVQIYISAKTTEKNIDRIISVIDTSGEYGMKINYLPDTSVSIDIKVPNNKFNCIDVSSVNGKIQISDLSCINLNCTSKDNRLSLSGLNCSIINATTSNSKIELSDISSDKIFIKASNSPVIIYNTYGSFWDVKTSKGRISVEISDDYTGNGEINLLTDNGKIDVDLSYLSPNTGIHLDATSSDNSINVNITDITYIVNEKLSSSTSHVICQTSDYDNCKNKLKIIAGTSNANINFT